MNRMSLANPFGRGWRGARFLLALGLAGGLLAPAAFAQDAPPSDQPPGESPSDPVPGETPDSGEIPTELPSTTILLDATDNTLTAFLSFTVANDLQGVLQTSTDLVQWQDEGDMKAYSAGSPAVFIVGDLPVDGTRFFRFMTVQ